MGPSRDELLDAIGAMSVGDLVDLVAAIRERFGVVDAVRPYVEERPLDAVLDGDPEPTSFNVVLTAAGAQKIQVIKAVREVTTLGLKEAKDVVDGAPSPVKEGVNREEAEALRKRLEEAGASVEIKPA